MSILTGESRRRLLDEYFDIVRRLEGDGSANGDADSLIDRRADLIFEYQEGFKARPVSRCPLTGESASLAIDTVDLDGLWWNWSTPLRGDDELPDSFFAYAGSMVLDEGAVAPAPFVARPGPGTAFVVPRLLEHPTMQAVLSTVPVGPHRGVLVMYFAGAPYPLDLERVNDWGAAHYFARTSEGFGLHVVPERAEDFDFDLRPWLTSGKLAWIAPGDETLSLRSSVDDCPYLTLSGERERAMVINGEVIRLAFESEENHA